MTIPYPKREFINDDDSDSKSSAAKVTLPVFCVLDLRKFDMAKNDTDERSTWVSTLLLKYLTYPGPALSQCRSTVLGQCCSNVGSVIARFRDRHCICRLNCFDWSL